MLSKETIKTSKKTVVIALTLLGVGLMVAAGWFFRDILMIVFTAYLLMLALQTPIKKLLKWTRLPRC